MVIPSASRGVLIGSAAIFISFLGASLTFPFLQAQRDKLGCDALCYGSMQSTRSGLSMVGTVLVGRMSDRMGRACALWIGTFASIISYIINLHGGSITAIWLAIIPAALFNQNFSVLKALFADYSAEYGYSETERASAVGRLGMAVGVSFMIGPVLGASFLSNYEQATTIAIVFVCLSACLLYFLPTPKSISEVPELSTGLSAAISFADVSKTQATIPCSTINAAHQDNCDETNRYDATTNPSSISWLIDSTKKAVTGFFYLPALQTPGARLLLFVRCGMGLAFNIFMTVWTVSLKTRFDFGPKGHAYFMGWIGLWYALSQGFLARESIKRSGNSLTKLLLTCILTLSFGRVMAMATSSLTVVYAVMAAVIIALGIMNTAITSACSRLAGRDQLGGLYGVMESVESIAGLIGPTLGGVLFKMNSFFPLFGVVFIYSIVFCAVYLFYQKHVLDAFYDSADAIYKKTDTATTVRSSNNSTPTQSDDGINTPPYSECCLDDDAVQFRAINKNCESGADELSDDASSTDTSEMHPYGTRSKIGDKSKSPSPATVVRRNSTDNIPSAQEDIVDDTKKFR